MRGVVPGAWAYRRLPAITVLPLPGRWHIEHRALISGWALASKVVVATK